MRAAPGFLFLLFPKLQEKCDGGRRVARIVIVRIGVDFDAAARGLVSVVHPAGQGGAAVHDGLVPELGPFLNCFAIA